MSSYRDDTQETAIAASSTWMGLSAIVGEVAIASGAVLFGLMVMHADTANAADSEFWSVRAVSIESAHVGDSVMDAKRSQEFITDGGSASESLSHRTFSASTDSAQASDAVIDNLQLVTVETATASDFVQAARTSTAFIVESAAVTDSPLHLTIERIEVEASAIDQALGTKHASQSIEDVAQASDDTLAGNGSAIAVVGESAKLSSYCFDELHARDLVHDSASALDEVVSNVGAFQAWTANAENWAMSRYDPLPGGEIAVIDGSLYCITQEGVYFAGSEDETFTATLRTGRIDVSSGKFVHPVGAYLEYELVGTAQMTVTTTQDGSIASYVYELAPRSASALSSGRFVFGKGLRGRHFSFLLQMTGKRGNINDLSVTVAQTNRRV